MSRIMPDTASRWHTKRKKDSSHTIPAVPRGRANSGRRLPRRRRLPAGDDDARRRRRTIQIYGSIKEGTFFSYLSCLSKQTTHKFNQSNKT